MQASKEIKNGLMIVSIFGIGAATLLGSFLFSGKNDEKVPGAKAVTSTFTISIINSVTGVTVSTIRADAPSVDDPKMAGLVYANDRIRVNWNYNNPNPGSIGVVCRALGSSPKWNPPAVPNTSPVPPVSNPAGTQLDNYSGFKVFTEAPGEYTYSATCANAVNPVVGNWLSGNIGIIVEPGIRQ